MFEGTVEFRQVVQVLSHNGELVVLYNTGEVYVTGVDHPVLEDWRQIQTRFGGDDYRAVGTT